MESKGDSWKACIQSGELGGFFLPNCSLGADFHAKWRNVEKREAPTIIPPSVTLLHIVIGGTAATHEEERGRGNRTNHRHTGSPPSPVSTIGGIERNDENDEEEQARSSTAKSEKTGCLHCPASVIG
jgi:hypothetical protein